MSDKIRILLADDHPFFLLGVEALLSEIGGFEVVFKANDGDMALRKINRLKPDIAILDIDMPKKTGVQVAQVVREKAYSTKIIFLTSHTDTHGFIAAYKLSPDGIVFKESALTELGRCLEKVLRNEKFISRATRNYWDQNKEKFSQLSEFKKKIGSLTPSEKRVLLFVSEMKTTQEIADELFNSVKTIENHRRNISQKLDLKGANQLVYFALEHQELIAGICNKTD